MENTLSYINVLPSTKKEIDYFSTDIIEQVESGLIDAVTLQIQLKSIETTIEKIKTGIKKYAINQHLKNGNNYEYTGASVSITERTTFYFEPCNDSELNELNEQIEKLTKEKKEREAFLKTLKTEFARVDTGEIIYPPKKSSQSIINITLK